MFRTELTIAPQERQLARTARVLTVGSCFAESLGARLRLNKVNALVNPFGTVFQPLALAQLLRAAVGEEQDWQQHVVEARGRWQSYDLHSTIGAESPVELLQTIQETVQRVGDFARTADMVVLTLGTAWAYRLRETGELVSNLHKLPASLFEKELLTADEIVNSLAEVHALLRRINPEVRIVLTVSPVRHIKDTLPLNAVSKSVLRVACHYLSELLPGVSYFPAYELLTDELRDYRFYASDMLHPSEVAEDYIWDKFARAYFDADFGRFRKEWAAVRQSLGHRPLHLGAPEHRAFLDQTAERLERLNSQGVDVRQEIRDVQRQLVALPPPKPTRVADSIPDDGEERIDIGEDMITPATPSEPHADSLTQPNRRNENRRNGRRNERNGQDRRNGHASVADGLPTELEVGPADSNLPEPAEETAIAAVEAVLAGGEPDLLLPEEGAAYPAKKKKRRSRGGAKRTARKNAARLVTEQPEGTEPIGLATEELLEELAQEATGVHMTAEVEAITVLLDVPAKPSRTFVGDSPATDPMDQPLLSMSPVRKRGTGPTPKKSTVITKSVLVKRGKRTDLYRAPAPAEQEAAVSEPITGSVQDVPAMAPIISPPIIPIALLERPAVSEAMLATPVEELITTTLANVEPATPPKPRRGRPKAAAAPTEVTLPDVAATPEVSPAIVEAANEPMPTIEKPTARTARPAGKKLATKKHVSSKPTTGKDAAAKKPAARKAVAKAATSRRAKPPGTDTPPAGDSPAT
ncbi:GSCFA domain-containing protein [Hymenobacter sp. H14-R3]|uniref:GSCFA domain-containing protein n=1 Tax=Hymenobacter sp. H14-R3 TaxID=3046308 RepID=UPI0024B90FBA|nr:GSCFA domain-containing protein [Hymenobacter sp. H14-R3]MDJ0365039.1 GSCFA domain-containing protein [Hymenobacter sp. H14-R3]